jgi:hypothetical protein
MFARPHTADSCRYGREVDRSFTQIAKPLLEKAKFLESVDDEFVVNSPTQRSKATSKLSHTTTTTNRTGDSLSYAINAIDNTIFPQTCARTMYRVVSYKNNEKSGKKIFFDPLDGRIFNLSPGFVDRISHNVVVFESKTAALSERLPSNQVGGTKGGNGLYPRLLLAFGKNNEIFFNYF